MNKLIFILSIFILWGCNSINQYSKLGCTKIDGSKVFVNNDSYEVTEWGCYLPIYYKSVESKERLNGRYLISYKFSYIKASFINGKMDGLVQVYDRKKRLTDIIEYENGYKKGVHIHYDFEDSSNLVTTITNFYNGKKHNLEKKYINNRLVSEIYYSFNTKSTEYIFSENNSLDTLNIFTYEINHISRDKKEKIRKHPEYDKDFLIKDFGISVNSEKKYLQDLYDLDIFSHSIVNTDGSKYHNNCRDEEEGAYLIVLNEKEYVVYYSAIGYDGHFELK